MGAVCPSRTMTSLPPSSHIRRVVSKDPVTIRFPQGEKATVLTHFVCPSRGSNKGVPVFPSHIRTVRSLETEANRLASEVTATQLSRSECPINGPITSSPDSASQTRTVLSSEQDTSRLPFAENARPVISALWPVAEYKRLPQAQSDPAAVRGMLGRRVRHGSKVFASPFGKKGRAER